MRLAIGGPTRDTGPVSFALDLAQLYAYTREKGPWPTVTVGFKVSTYIHVGREEFLEAALTQGATHVLWLDTDMSFPPYTANMLAMHEQPIVACNYVMRDGSGQCTARRDEFGRVLTSEHSTGLQAVDSVGMGVLLMRTDVVEFLPRPWFAHGRNASLGDIGEDIMFCQKLRAAGHTIYIDHDLSKEVGHVGQHTYRIPASVAVAV